MTTTGPLPKVRDDLPLLDGKGIARAAVLASMEAPDTGCWFRYPTADAVVDEDKGVLYIVADIDPDPADWECICDLIAIVGWDNGSQRFRRDPGEPAYNALAQVCTWRLQYARLTGPDPRN